MFSHDGTEFLQFWQEYHRSGMPSPGTPRRSVLSLVMLTLIIWAKVISVTFLHCKVILSLFKTSKYLHNYVR